MTIKDQIGKMQNHIYTEVPFGRLHESVYKISLDSGQFWTDSRSFAVSDVKGFIEFIKTLDWQHVSFTGSGGKYLSITAICDNETVIDITIYEYGAEILKPSRTIGAIIDYDEEGESSQKVPKLEVTVSSLAQDKLEAVFKIFSKKFPLSEKVSTKGEVNMLINEGMGIGMKYLGKVSLPFFRNNYSKDIGDKFDDIVKEMGSPNPFGRLILLQGPPGTGKSFFVRSLLSKIDTTNVYIPATFIGNVSGPNIVGTIVEARRSKQKPILFIVEDADDSIKSREAGGNAGFLSDILNFTDGLLGELADIRIIATTNAKMPNIDAAISRPGRLFSIVEFGMLPKKHCVSLYKEYKGGGDPEELFSKKEYSLAEFYRILKDYKDNNKAKKSVGQYV